MAETLQPENYLVIQGWMITELGLSGRELILYALIFGLSQGDGEGYAGNLKYLTEWTGSTKRNVISVLKSLVEKGYIEKRDESRNGIKIVRYVTNFTSGEIISPGMSKISPPVKKFHHPFLSLDTSSGENEVVSNLDTKCIHDVYKSDTEPSRNDYNCLTNCVEFESQTQIYEEKENQKEKVDIKNNIYIDSSEVEDGNTVVAENTKYTKRFIPPSVDEVNTYCQERNNSIDPEAFVDFYESKGWMIGKNRMKDWKAAVRTWERKRNKQKEPDKEFPEGLEFV